MLPVLWLCGPSGVGKSTVAWQLYRERPGAGYIDIDQIGMCYPEIADDPGRTFLESRILARAVAHFDAAGATGLIVSGYIDQRRGIDALPGAGLTAIRLRCDQPELRQRLKDRARDGEQPEPALRVAAEFDSYPLPYPCIDTTGRTAADVLDIVRSRWPEQPEKRPGEWPAPVPPRGEVLWVRGTTAVGKSTVGYEIAVRMRAAGWTTGFVDLQQIGFLDGDNRRLTAANLAAVRAEFAAQGATRLVMVGDVDAGYDPTGLTVCRLLASPDRLRDRIRRRGLGEGPPIAGDELRGQPDEVLAAAYEKAVERQRSAIEREQAPIQEKIEQLQAPTRESATERRQSTEIEDVDTDDRTPGELAEAIIAAAGW